MSLDDLLAPLSHVPLFAGLQMAQLMEIARRGEKLRYSPGDVLMRAGQPGDAAYLVLSGAVDRVGDSEPVAAERVAPGSLLAEMAMFVEHIHTATYVARERAYGLKLSRTSMHAVMVEDAVLIEHFQRRITEKVRRVAEELRQMENPSSAPAAPMSGTRPSQPAASPMPVPKAPTPAPRFVAAPRAWR
jgi:signal-transduction protein with cAMP-binding, CBS, and nucleotidyltransferase domain